MLDSIIALKTRLYLFIKLFIDAANRGHMRGLPMGLNESTCAIRKELNNLFEAGYLKERGQQNRVSYWVDVKHPLFRPLKGIAHKYLGLDVIAAKALDGIWDARQVVPTGTGGYVESHSVGMINMTIVGAVRNIVYLLQLASNADGVVQWKMCFAFSDKELTIGSMLYGEA